MDFHIVDYFIDPTKKWVIILPSSWMNEERTQCWIPQVKVTELKRLCKAKCQPQRDWTRYSMLLRRSYCTYNDARKDLSRAEQHSDLNTDNELHGMQIDHCGRKASSRVRRPRECYSPPSVSKRVHSAIGCALTDVEDSSESDSEDDAQLLSLPASWQVSSIQHNFHASFPQPQSYAIGGPSSVHSLPGAGPSSVHSLPGAGLSSVHSLPGAGPSSVQSYAIAGPSVQSYAIAGPSVQSFAIDAPSVPNNQTAGPSSTLSYPITDSPPMQSYSVAGPSTVQINATAGPSSVSGNFAEGPSSNSTTGPSSVNSYSVFGPSSAHNYPVGGQSSVQDYPSASLSPLHHYSRSGPSSLHHNSTAGPMSAVERCHRQSVGASKNSRGSDMSSSPNVELRNDSIRGSDLKKILRRIEMVVENQLQHNKDLEHLKNQARQNGSIIHPTITEIEGLPLQTMAELERYEISLGDEDNRRQLVGMISSIGGNGFKDAVERALAAVASDKVLRDVNWLGRTRKDKQKKGCHNMLFIKCVRKQPDFEDVVWHNNTVFQTHVKNWLRHAPARASNLPEE